MLGHTRTRVDTQFVKMDYFKFFSSLPYKVWSSIVVWQKKVEFLLHFFKNVEKAKHILIETIERNVGVKDYQKLLHSEH